MKLHRMVVIMIFVLGMFFPTSKAIAQSDGEEAGVESTSASNSDLQLEKAKLELEKARIEAEKAKAEAERAKAEAEKARLESETSKIVDSKVYKEKEQDKKLRSKEFHRHVGFFLQMQLGFGFGNYSVNGSLTFEPDTGTPGPAIVVDSHHNNMVAIGGLFKIGGCAVENFALHLTTGGNGVIPGDNSVGLVAAFLGVGGTYYFMPYNLFLSFSVGYIPTILIRDGGPDKNYVPLSGNGGGFIVELGKEWWVSDNWGLGLSLNGRYGYANVEDTDVHQGACILMFSATYN